MKAATWLFIIFMVIAALMATGNMPDLPFASDVISNSQIVKDSTRTLERGLDVNSWMN